MSDLPPDPPDYETPLGYTLFSEDIRQEIDGKFTVVGAITGHVAVPSFPAILPKLGVAAFYRQPWGFPLAAVNICAIWEPVGGDRRLVVGAPMDMRDMAQPADPSWLAAAVQMVLSPFPVTEPGTLFVRAYRDGQPPLRMGGLRFVKGEAPKPDPPEAPQTTTVTAGEPVRVAPHKVR